MHEPERGKPARVGYLAALYPIVSHSFLLREVEGLRRSGLDVETMSVWRSPRSELLDEASRREGARTWALDGEGRAAIVWSHVRALALAPRAYGATLAKAFRSRPRDRLGLAWRAAAFRRGFALVRHCERRAIHHLHVHHASAGAEFAVLACTYGRASGRGPRSWSLSLHGPGEWYARNAIGIDRKVADAEWVACISDWTRGQAMFLSSRRHWHKLEVLRLGVPVEQFARSAPAPAPAEPLVLSLGRLVPQKGQAVLVGAIAHLRAQGRDVRCVIAGAGPLEDDLRALCEELGVADLVELPGAVPPADVPSLLERASVFCLPSFAEGLPVVLMEAMASGLPVVASRVMGIPELVEDGSTGLLVPPGREVELAAALIRVLDDAELAARLVRAGREKVRCDHDGDAAAAALARRLRRSASDAAAAAAR
ncbi:MAG TPA: glycosyltransferase [Thermoleophilaceae bacterium]